MALQLAGQGVSVDTRTMNRVSSQVKSEANSIKRKAKTGQKALGGTTAKNKGK
jgi:hypothetical protein